MKNREPRNAEIIRDQHGWISPDRHLPNSGTNDPASDDVLIKTDAYYWPNITIGCYEYCSEEEGGSQWHKGHIKGKIIGWQPLPGRELDVCQAGDGFDFIMGEGNGQ